MSKLAGGGNTLRCSVSIVAGKVFETGMNVVLGIENSWQTAK